MTMLASDSESKWPAKLLADKRVTHYWDDGRVVGTWYGENVTAEKPGHVDDFKTQAGGYARKAVDGGCRIPGHVVFHRGACVMGSVAPA